MISLVKSTLRLNQNFSLSLIDDDTTRDPFLKRPGNFLCPKANFKIKTCQIVVQSLALKRSILLFIVSVFFKIIETFLERNTANIKQLSVPEKLGAVSKNRPLETKEIQDQTYMLITGLI